MPNETPSLTPPAGVNGPPANGTHPPAADRAALEREYLRVQCQKLRGWCLRLLDESPAAASLPADDIRDLRDNPPTRTGEQILAELLTFAGRVPPDGPFHPAVADLAAERERLKRLYFTLSDAIDPYVPMSDDELKRMTTDVRWGGAGAPASATRD